MKKNIAIVITRLDLGGAQKVTVASFKDIIQKQLSLRGALNRSFSPVQGDVAIPVFNGASYG